MSWHSATPHCRHQILFNSASVTDITKMRMRCLNLPTCEIDTTTYDFMTTYQQNSWRNCVLRPCGYGRLVASWLTEQSPIWYFPQNVIQLSHSLPTVQPLKNFRLMRRRADFTGGVFDSFDLTAFRLATVLCACNVSVCVRAYIHTHAHAHTRVQGWTKPYVICSVTNGKSGPTLKRS